MLIVAAAAGGLVWYLKSQSTDNDSETPQPKNPGIVPPELTKSQVSSVQPKQIIRYVPPVQQQQKPQVVQGTSIVHTAAPSAPSQQIVKVAAVQSTSLTPVVAPRPVQTLVQNQTRTNYLPYQNYLKSTVVVS